MEVVSNKEAAHLSTSPSEFTAGFRLTARLDTL
jgi:hypothetical protein